MNHDQILLTMLTNSAKLKKKFNSEGFESFLLQKAKFWEPAVR